MVRYSTNLIYPGQEYRKSTGCLDPNIDMRVDGSTLG